MSAAAQRTTDPEYCGRQDSGSEHVSSDRVVFDRAEDGTDLSRAENKETCEKHHFQAAQSRVGEGGEDHLENRNRDRLGNHAGTQGIVLLDLDGRPCGRKTIRTRESQHRGTWRYSLVQYSCTDETTQRRRRRGSLPALSSPGPIRGVYKLWYERLLQQVHRRLACVETANLRSPT